MSACRSRHCQKERLDQILNSSSEAGMLQRHWEQTEFLHEVFKLEGAQKECL